MLFIDKQYSIIHHHILKVNPIDINYTRNDHSFYICNTSCQICRYLKLVKQYHQCIHSPLQSNLPIKNRD